jgi:hypothetical protein
MIYGKDGDISSLDRPVILTSCGSPPERIACADHLSHRRTRNTIMDMLTLNSEGVRFHFLRSAWRLIDAFSGGSAPASYRMRLATCLSPLRFASDPLLGTVYLDFNTPDLAP